MICFERTLSFSVLIEPREDFPVQEPEVLKQQGEQLPELTSMDPPLSNVVPVGVKMLFTPQPVVASTSSSSFSSSSSTMMNPVLNIQEGTQIRCKEERSLLEMLTILNNNEYSSEGVF